MANKVISFVLVLSLLFVGLGFVSLDPSAPNRRFSELCEPFFDVISHISDVARDLVNYLFPSDTNIVSDLNEPVDPVQDNQLSPAQTYRFLYECDIKTHRVWHHCFLLRVNVTEDENRDNIFVVVFDDCADHSLEGWSCRGGFKDKAPLLSVLYNYPGWSFPMRSVRNWSLSRFDYFSLQQEYPDHPLYSDPND